MTINSHQISLAETFEECQQLLLGGNPTFFTILEEHVNLDEFIPYSFRSTFYQQRGRKREYPLYGFLSSLIIQKILSIPSDSLLINLLSICSELREFCGFNKVPDASKFTRFKQDFLPHIEHMFNTMVDYTEPICKAIDSTLASTFAFDTTGIELYVSENNPKELNSLIRKLKGFYKNKPDIDPYKMSYGLMPSKSSSCNDAKQLYINGHFCYADKFGIITNGLGIIRHIAFFDDEFKIQHPELLIDKKSDSPDEDKSIGDSSSLNPVLKIFLVFILK